MPTLSTAATAKKANGLPSVNENGNIAVTGGTGEAPAVGIANGMNGVTSSKAEAKPAWGKAA